MGSYATTGIDMKFCDKCHSCINPCGREESMHSQSYWEDISNPIRGTQAKSSADILVIGSGFTGASAAYHLASKQKEFSVAIVDDGCTGSFSRNAGHILWGMSEHYYCQVEHWGEEKAKDIGGLSLSFMDLNKDLYSDMWGIYKTHAMNDSEEEVMKKSWDYEKEHFDHGTVYTSGKGNPIVNRNNVLMKAYNEGVSHVECQVDFVEKRGDGYRVHYTRGGWTAHKAVVMCTNAYTKLILDDTGNTLEPFKGQIIVSEKLGSDLYINLNDQFGNAWSFDNGFIYGQFVDGRVLIGGWRNNVSGGEVDSYDLSVNTDISDGLKDFVADRMDLKGLIWEYDWAGLMASTPNGLPIVKQRSSDGIYIAAGMNGYGHSWGPGCGAEVANMVLGLEVNKNVLKYFRGD